MPLVRRNRGLVLCPPPCRLGGRQRCWTGSCPCQPFSTAGKRKGFADERHLWPSWFWLIGQCRPPVVLGEQVTRAIKVGWLDLVSSDLEGIGYAIGTADTPAAGVGAPHIRQRLYFLARRSPDDALADAGRQRSAVWGGLETWERRRLETKDRVKNGNGFGTPLTIAAQLAHCCRPPGRPRAARRRRRRSRRGGRATGAGTWRQWRGRRAGRPRRPGTTAGRTQGPMRRGEGGRRGSSYRTRYTIS